jgi:hypothetical protein
VTKVTPSSDFLRTKIVSDAAAVRDAIIGRGDWRSAPRSYHRDWMLVTLMLDRCDPAADWTQWLDAVRRIAMGTLPFLTAAENADVMATIRAHRCVSRLPPTEQEWLAVFDAVGARDAKRLQTLGSAMLESGKVGAGSPVRSFLVHAAMVGALAQGNPADALAVWEKHGKAMVEKQPLKFDTRVLLSLAQPESSRQASVASPGRRAN